MSNRDASSLGTLSLLCVVLLLGAVLRLPGMAWGEGDLKPGAMVHFHPDETTHVNLAKQLLDRGGDEESYVKGFAFQIALMAQLIEALGSRVSSDDLYRIGRLLSLLYGLATIVVVYALARQLSPDRRAFALIAAMLAALSGLAVTQSHFAVADAAGVFYTWLSIYFSLIAYRRNSLRYLVLATAASAVAVACKVMIAACPPVAVSLLLRKRIKYEPWLLLLIFLLTFFLAVGASMDISALHSAWEKIHYDSIAVIPDHSPWESLTAIVISLLPAFSLPVILLSLRGALLTYRYARRAEDPAWLLIPLSAVLAQTAVIVSVDDPFERHLLLFAPGLSLLAGWAWLELTESGWRGLLWSTPVFAYLLYFVIDSQLSFVFDNRVLAREWVRTHIPHGSRIWMGPYADLKLSRKQYRIKSFGRSTRPPGSLQDIDLLVLHEAHTYRYHRSRLSPWSKPRADNVYHGDRFMRKYSKAIFGEEPALRPIKRFVVAGNRSPERLLYKRYWGQFQSFTGDVVLYLPVSIP